MVIKNRTLTRKTRSTGTIETKTCSVGRQLTGDGIGGNTWITGTWIDGNIAITPLEL